jgi:uncharacterized protein (DUF1697 family)
MIYVLLLRGINVGGNHKVSMKVLKMQLEFLNYKNVFTYINSGNIIFEANKSRVILESEIKKLFSEKYNFPIVFLLKTKREIVEIAKKIPENWTNDSKQKTDVAYLFKEVDKKQVLDILPVKKELVSLIYVKGAVVWNVRKSDLTKSHLNKVIGSEIYKKMTVRNCNTARFLAQML